MTKCSSYLYGGHADTTAATLDQQRFTDSELGPLEDD
jgi:hypothetical protein